MPIAGEEEFNDIMNIPGLAIREGCLHEIIWGLSPELEGIIIEKGGTSMLKGNSAPQKKKTQGRPEQPTAIVNPWEIELKD